MEAISFLMRADRVVVEIPAEFLQTHGKLLGFEFVEGHRDYCDLWVPIPDVEQYKAGKREPLFAPLIAYRVRDAIDESNFHVVGDNIQHISDLLDKPGAFGTIDQWVCAIASEFLVVPDDLEDYDVSELAAGYLGMTPSEFLDLLESLPVGIVQERLLLVAENADGWKKHTFGGSL